MQKNEVSEKDRKELLEALWDFGSWKYDGDFADLVTIYQNEGIEALKSTVTWMPTPRLFV